MCKGPYVILHGGSLIKKKSNVSFKRGHYLEPRVFTKGRYIRLIFSKRKKEKPLYTDQRKRFFSPLLGENFSHASCFGSDKGAHTSSADRT